MHPINFVGILKKSPTFTKKERKDGRKDLVGDREIKRQTEMQAEQERERYTYIYPSRSSIFHLQQRSHLGKC